MIKKILFILLISALASSIYGVILYKKGSPIFTSKKAAFQKIKAKPAGFEEVLKLYEQGVVVFVDVRDEKAYKKAHLPGAVLFSPSMKEPPRDKVIVIYNDENTYPQAFEAAKWFSEKGYRVLLFFDGLRIWKEQGKEVATSEGC